jgi:hypothetical protein
LFIATPHTLFCKKTRLKSKKIAKEFANKDFCLIFAPLLE